MLRSVLAGLLVAAVAGAAGGAAYCLVQWQRLAAAPPRDDVFLRFHCVVAGAACTDLRCSRTERVTSLVVGTPGAWLGAGILSACLATLLAGLVCCCCKVKFLCSEISSVLGLGSGCGSRRS